MIAGKRGSVKRSEMKKRPRLSLHPLTLDAALSDLLKTPPPGKAQGPNEALKSRKKKPRKAANNAKRHK
jgi:hypothetical protein